MPASAPAIAPSAARRPMRAGAGVGLAGSCGAVIHCPPSRGLLPASLLLGPGGVNRDTGRWQVACRSGPLRQEAVTLHSRRAAVALGVLRPSAAPPKEKQ